MIITPVWQRLARHEAGHAVVAILLGVEVGPMQLHPARGYGETMTRITTDEIDAKIMMGGWAATPWNASTHDIRAAAALVGRDGVTDAARAAVRLLAGQESALAVVEQALLACDGGVLDGARATDLVLALQPTTVEWQ